MLISHPEVAHAPGCFGSALAFKEEDPQCQSCMFASDCKPRSQARLAALRAQYGIAEPKPKVARPAIKIASGETLTVPVKVAELIGRIERAGVSVTEAFAQGRNPFVSTPLFLRLFSHLLLRLPSVTRPMLTTAFQTKLEWTPQTAASHTSLAVQTFLALGAIDDLNGQLTIRRT